jgi:hypothetical protein
LSEENENNRNAAINIDLIQIKKEIISIYLENVKIEE